jgi:hypothetical protein
VAAIFVNESERNVQSLYCSFHFDPLTNMPPQAILVSDWSISKKTFPPTLLGQMKWNLVWSVYGRSSIENTHIVLIREQTWPPHTILVSDWSISKNLLLWNCLEKLSKCTRKYKSFSVLIELSGLGDYIISIIGSNPHSLGGYETFSAPIVFQLVYLGREQVQQV